jgi:hypothetical protein
VKTKLLFSFILVLVGTNLFTYATTRYTTTKEVLTQAGKRMDVVLKQEGLYEQIYPSDRPPRHTIHVAISQAGGMYYWWNEGLLWWGGAVLLTVTGVLVPFVRLR